MSWGRDGEVEVSRELLDLSIDAAARLESRVLGHN
jgi:hypothetical protein